MTRLIHTGATIGTAPGDQGLKPMQGLVEAAVGRRAQMAAFDPLLDSAAIGARDRKCSTSYIQRKLGIGYQKAARLVEQMEDQGVVSPANHVGKREILLPEH